MSYYYPQVAVKLRILPEDYKLSSDASLQQIVEVDVQAKNLTITVNDYRTTDTFTLDIDYKNFPFDPRSIRALGVTIYMADQRKLYTDDGKLNLIKPGDATKLDPAVSNAVFSGFADKETLKFDDTKRTVHFEGRDFTSLLIDKKYQTSDGRVSPIALNEPLDVALKRLLANFKATAEISVVNRTGTTLPTIAKYYPGFGDPLAGSKNTGSKETYWEIIQDMVNRAGLICFMRLDQLILATPKNQATTQNDDIKFVYGRNIKNLEYERKLGRLKGFNIRVRSRVRKTVLQADIPREATAAWCKQFGVNKEDVSVPVLKPDGSLDKSTGATTQQAAFLTFPVPNISDKDQLIRIGQTVFEQYSLQQLEGSFSTREMLGRGPSKDPLGDQTKSFKQYDLTQLQKGQSIVIEIDMDDLAQISRLADTATREQYLIRRNYDRKVASIFAKTLGKFSPRFQIKSYTMTMDQDNGWDLNVKFQNILDLTQAGL